jgi:hypothetical protein
MVVHAGSSLGVTDAAMSGLKKRLFMQDRLCVGKPVYPQVGASARAYRR